MVAKTALCFVLEVIGTSVKPEPAYHVVEVAGSAPVLARQTA